jgi:hypothetical protein
MKKKVSREPSRNRNEELESDSLTHKEISPAKAQSRNDGGRCPSRSEREGSEEDFYLSLS